LYDLHWPQMIEKTDGVERLGLGAIVIALALCASLSLLLWRGFDRYAEGQAYAIALAVGFLVAGLLAATVSLGVLAWRRERALRRSNAALERGLDELERLNEAVSHDLRSPLGAVVNFAVILREDQGDRLDAKGKEHLQRLADSAATAVSMLEDLLAYTRSGRKQLRMRRLDMPRLVREVCDAVAADLPKPRCGIEVGDLPNAYADEDTVRFVFTALVGNACTFGRKGDSPRVEVGGYAGTDEVVFFVRDQRVGFDTRAAQRLLEIFGRVPVPGDPESHGVGLATAARMMRRSGGRLWAQAAVGAGATFYVAIAATESFANRTNAIAS